MLYQYILWSGKYIPHPKLPTHRLHNATHMLFMSGIIFFLLKGLWHFFNNGYEFKTLSTFFSLRYDQVPIHKFSGPRVSPWSAAIILRNANYRPQQIHLSLDIHILSTRMIIFLLLPAVKTWSKCHVRGGNQVKVKWNTRSVLLSLRTPRSLADPFLLSTSPRPPPALLCGRRTSAE